MDKLQEANQRLLEKRKLQQTNTLESVKNLLSVDKIEEARTLAVKSSYSNPSEEIAKLFEAKTINSKKCECGNNIKAIFNRSMLKYYYQHNVCSECYAKEVELREEQEKKMIELEEKHKAETERKHWEAFLQNKDEIVIEILRRCNVPPRLQKAIVDNPPVGNYFITGSIGTGKSYLAAGLLKNYVYSTYPLYTNEGYKININPLPVYVTVPELLLDIRDCFGDSSIHTEKGLIDHYTSAPFLVLDDLGIEKVSEWSLQTLYIIINRRYEESEEKHTVITSNLSLDNISKKLDDRIGSRINGMCKTLCLKGKDRRLKNYI